MADYYYEHLCNPLVTLPDRISGMQNAYHLFPVLGNEKLSLPAAPYLSAEETAKVVELINAFGR